MAQADKHSNLSLYRATVDSKINLNSLEKKKEEKRRIALFESVCLRQQV